MNKEYILEVFINLNKINLQGLLRFPHLNTTFFRIVMFTLFNRRIFKDKITIQKYWYLKLKTMLFLLYSFKISPNLKLVYKLLKFSIIKKWSYSLYIYFYCLLISIWASNVAFRTHFAVIFTSRSTDKNKIFNTKYKIIFFFTTCSTDFSSSWKLYTGKYQEISTIFQYSTIFVYRIFQKEHEFTGAV